MDKQGNTIAGRKRNDEFDFYETPKWATEKAVESRLHTMRSADLTISPH